MVVTVLAAAALAGLLLRSTSPKAVSEPAATGGPSSAPESSAAIPATAPEASPLAVPGLETVSNPPPAGETAEETHAAYVEKRRADLADMAMTDDPASLQTILGELNNRDPELRKAAREAAVQFGSREALPALTDAMAQTDDPAEKAALLEAIEFLKLPSLAETIQSAPAGAAPSAAPPRRHARGWPAPPTPAPPGAGK